MDVLYVLREDDRIIESVQEAQPGTGGWRARRRQRARPPSRATRPAEWDARYSAAEGRTWSDNPNSTLVAEAGALIPGQALDVGCGEGADAV